MCIVDRLVLATRRFHYESSVRSYSTRDKSSAWEDIMKESVEEIQFNADASGEAGDSSSAAMNQQPRPVARKTGRQASQGRSSQGGLLLFVFRAVFF